MKTLVLPLLLALPFSTAQAQTFLIDDDGLPGAADFSDIQPAIDAASNGALLLVLPGDYSGFLLPEGMTILGMDDSSPIRVNGPVTISGIPGLQRAILSSMRMRSLRIEDSPGHVLLDNVNVSLSQVLQGNDVQAIYVENCKDVRLYETTVKQYSYSTSSPNGPNAIDVTNSRLELIASNITGDTGFDGDCYSSTGNGSAALWASNSSIISVFRSTLNGGNGGHGESFCEWTESYGGDGDDGFYIRGGSNAVIAGDNSNNINHGDMGYGDCFPSCIYDGVNGTGLALQGSSTVRLSGVSVESQTVASGSTVVTPAVDDPFLDRFGTLQAGRVQNFWIHGTPGDNVTFYLGRAPAITVDPTQAMDQLVSRERSYNLGSIPATGRLNFKFTIPLTFPTGFDFYTQAQTTSASGTSLLTNSVPLVVRY